MKPTHKTRFTVKEAAQRIGVSPRRIRQMIGDGEIKSLVKGRFHYITRKNVEKELARREPPNGITVPEAAARMKLTENRVRHLVRTGRLVGVTHRTKVYVDEQSISSYEGD